MGEGYNTGDDMIFETFAFVMIVSFLTTNPSYIEAIPLPPAWTVILTVLVGAVAVYVSGGRTFWAVLGFSFWVALKLGLVKEDKTKYSGYYDEEGKFHLVEEKPDESANNGEERTQP